MVLMKFGYNLYKPRNFLPLYKTQLDHIINLTLLFMHIRSENLADYSDRIADNAS
jgi:hypothetical protein